VTRPTPPFVRNACVARGVIHGPSTIGVYNVAENNVLLLKSILLTNNGAAPANFGVNLGTSDGSVSIGLVSGSIANGASKTLDLWAALNATDGIIIGCDGGILHYWISGAILPFNPAFSATAM
jgi:hypothetical protein